MNLYLYSESKKGLCIGCWGCSAVHVRSTIVQQRWKWCVCVCAITWCWCWSVKMCCNVVRCEKCVLDIEHWRRDFRACVYDMRSLRPWVHDICTYLYRHPFFVTFFSFLDVVPSSKFWILNAFTWEHQLSALCPLFLHNLTASLSALIVH